MASQQHQKRMEETFGTGLDTVTGGNTVSLTFNNNQTTDVVDIHYNGTDNFTNPVGGGGGGGGGSWHNDDNDDNDNNDNNTANGNTIGRNSSGNIPINRGKTVNPNLLFKQAELTTAQVSIDAVVDDEYVPGYAKTPTIAETYNPCADRVQIESDKPDSEIVENMNTLINVSPDVITLAKELYAYSDFKDKPVAEIIDTGISHSTAFYKEYNLSAQRIFLNQTRETKYVSSTTTEVILNPKVEKYDGVNLFYLTQGKRFASVNTNSTNTCLAINLDKNTTNNDRTVRVTLVNKSNVKLQEFIITQKRNESKQYSDEDNHIKFSIIKDKIINPNLTAFVFVKDMVLTENKDAIKISFVTSGFEDIFASIFEFDGVADKLDMTKFKNKYIKFYSGDNVLVVENYDETGKNGDFQKQTKPKFCWSDIGLYSINLDDPDKLSYEIKYFRKYNADGTEDPNKIPFLSEHMYLRLKHNGDYVSSITIPINPNRKFNRYYNKIKKNSTDWKFNCKFSLSFRNIDRGYQPLTQIQFVQQNKNVSSVLQPATLSSVVENNKMNFSYINKEVIIETVDE